MNVTDMPGFAAEASRYRTGSYREVRVDGGERKNSEFKVR